jgi:hypothetical protein
MFSARSVFSAYLADFRFLFLIGLIFMSRNIHLKQTYANLVRGCFYEKSIKFNETQFYHFNFRLKFSWNLLNIVSKRFKEVCDFWTSPRKIEIKVQPIDLLSWIKFRGPVLNHGTSLQNFSFPSPSSSPEPRDHKVSLKPHSEATRKDPDLEKNPMVSFDILK